MADELFVAVCSLFTMILFRWSFHHLPQEKWQFLAAVPTCKGPGNCWQGINLTYYGFFNATAYTLACMLVIFLTAAADIPIGYTLALLLIILGVCMPGSRIVARNWVAKVGSADADTAISPALFGPRSEAVNQAWAVSR